MSLDADGTTKTPLRAPLAAPSDLPERPGTPIDRQTSATELIRFFDTQIELDVDVELLVRRAAALAGCPVGVRSADGTTWPSGRASRSDPRGHSRTRRLAGGAEVWLARAGTARHCLTRPGPPRRPAQAPRRRTLRPRDHALT